MEVKTIGVIGAGTMGRGIAYAAALGGYRTILEDVMPECLAAGATWIKKTLEEGVARELGQRLDTRRFSNRSVERLFHAREPSRAKARGIEACAREIRDHEHHRAIDRERGRGIRVLHLRSHPHRPRRR